MSELSPTQPHINQRDRATLTGQHGAIVWLTGLSGSGKSTIGRALEASLVRSGRCALVLDGDNLRGDLCSGLGFSATDRQENIRRIAIAARLVAEAGAVAIVAIISPFSASRAQARAIAAPMPFYEIYLSTPLAECERRDPKGLYRRARAGEIGQMTGIDSPYEPPRKADLNIDTTELTIEQALAMLHGMLASGAKS